MVVALVVRGILLMAGLAIVGDAAAMEVGETLTNQTFEWPRTYTSRWEGTYAEYPVTLKAGRTYEIATADPSGGTTLDTYVYLLDASFTVVAEDDDSNGSLLSKITYTPWTSGRFYIRLRASPTPAG
jgi:hypothetical protein